jgi:exosortase
MSDVPQTVSEQIKRERWGIAIAAALFTALFWDTIRQWALDCWELQDFSHCLLVPPVAFWLLWRRRREIGALPAGPSLIGLGILVLSLAIFGYGYARTLNVFQRLGTVGSVIGLAATFCGPRLLRRHPFPFAFLILALPIPYVIYTQISLVLKGLVTKLAASFLYHIGIPAIDRGNIIEIGDLSLGVVDACSGIRSVMAIVSVTLLLAYLERSGFLGGCLLALLTLPIAVALNILRILIMAVSLYRFEVDLTEGVAHEVLGLVIFALILALVYSGWLFVRWLLVLKPGLTENRVLA